ncbi:hypothetical protein [Ramlibacter tataouinensis]|uniref:Uncharacterized protein n=1 Tax=Ramlibacter tataouinensis (strain ATCC BAA-407 / DSM 14655 / LMG 21543 / TTB310) TaxID=365046 RepID=F5Y5Y9_RAMTT|nr:hypothetical protein [Ramlibacter tataouinensis]AEG91493.1 Hypothetical protein Rta_04220 [Ramlibacter tataouinensis TTB310]
MDPDERLSQAFQAWSAARDALGRQRNLLRIARERPGAAAQTVDEVLARLRSLEQECERRFAELLAAADERDGLR